MKRMILPDIFHSRKIHAFSKMVVKNVEQDMGIYSDLLIRLFHKFEYRYMYVTRSVCLSYFIVMFYFRLFIKSYMSLYILLAIYQIYKKKLLLMLWPKIVNTRRPSEMFIWLSSNIYLSNGSHLKQIWKFFNAFSFVPDDLVHIHWKMSGF